MAYLGNAPVVGDSTNSFKLLDDIASFTLTFDATDTSVVSISGDTLSFTNHRFITGQKVTYTDGGGTAIGGLSDGTSYFIIKVDQNTIKLATNASNAASSTAINLTSGAAGGSHTLNVKFDGVNTKFKATFNNGKKAKISRAGQISLSINGVIQQPQETSSPTVGYSVEADSTIVFSTAPTATDKVFATFIGEVAASFDLTDNTIDNFTGDGSTTIFNLSKEVPSSEDVLVTLDGVTQHPSDGSTTRSYSIINQALTFVSAPDTGVAIQARHIGFAGATSSEVTGFYGRTGNVALKSTDDISVQNISGVGATFTSNVNIEGVLTYEDVTNVDSIGIITARSNILVGSGITLSPDGNIFATGISTAEHFHSTDDLIVDDQISAGGNVKVGTGITLSPDGNVFTTGISTFGGNIQVSSSDPEIELNSGGPRFRVPASNTLTIHTGSGLGSANEERVRITSAGKVGIGTAVPDGQLHISSGTSGDCRVYIEADEDNNAEGDNPFLIFKQDGGAENGAVWCGNADGGNDNSLNLSAATSTGGGIRFFTSSTDGGWESATERLRINSSGNVKLPDNGKLQFGGSLGSGNGDLQIYHDGSESVIGNGTGTLQFLSPNEIRYRATTHHFLSYGNDESMAKFTDDGAVELYYDNTKHFETVSGGVSVTGNFTLSGELNMTAGGNENRFIDCSMDNGEGLHIRSTQGGDASHENMAIFVRQAQCELYYANSKKFETKTGGCAVTGYLELTSHLYAGDNDKVLLGDAQDFQIWHDGVGSIIQNDTGPTIIRGSGSNVDIRHSNDEIMIRCNGGSSVDLRFAGTSMFVTNAAGTRCVGDTALALDSWQGRLDRLWSDYPSISISPSTTYGNQGEFRVHGITGSSVGYGSGGDFSIDFRVDGAYQTGSDQRRKTNIEEITGALDTVKQLTGKKFNIINRSGDLDPNKGTQKQFGLIAQECKDIIPEVVKFHPDEDTPNENGWASAYGLDYGQLTPLLINAIKELSAKNDALETRIAALEG